MRPRIDLRFRPSLILFMDETGSCICEQLQNILHFTSFDPVLCQSLALLRVDSNLQRATRMQPSRAVQREQEQEEEDALNVMLERALKDVQNNRHIQHIIQAGYPIPNTRTQIFIVGDAHSPELAKVLDLVHNRLSKRGFTTLVCYIINAFRQRQITGSMPAISSLQHVEEPSTPDLLFTTERNLPGFCYLYEDMLNYPTPSFVSEQESYYATAEAIFALIATGLTTEPFFATHMQVGTPFGTYENVGSLSTSLIAFPRASILEFCSARLAIILMEQWDRDLRNQHTSADELDRLQGRARNFTQEVRNWIEDREPRPYANGTKKHTRQGPDPDTQEELRCPTLHILRTPGRRPVDADEVTLAEQQRQNLNQQRMYRSLEEETEKLFLLFWPADIQDEYKRQRRRYTAWTRLVFERGNRAVAAWNDWDKRATRAWNNAAERVNRETREFIDHLWSRDQNGFDMATVYVSELDDQIARLYNDLSHWRAEHDESYRESLAAFERMAQGGPWAIRDDASSLLNGQQNTGPAQAHPTMQGQHIAPDPDDTSTTAGSTTSNTGNILGVTPTPVRIASQHLPEREERIVQNLEQRIIWHQDLIPAIPTQVVTAIPAILALVLTILAWLPRPLPFNFGLPVPTTTLVIIGIIIVATAIVGFGHWYFRSRYIQRVEECKEDLLIFYRLYYANRCERREDVLRRNVLGPLRRTVQAIHERLNNLPQFVHQARDSFNEDAERVQEELFDSPAGLRDIFVANGERLQRERKNTLADFAAQMSKLRTKEPLEEWHRSPANLKRQLIQTFREQSESLMEMTDEETLTQIRDFATSVTSAYLQGPHVELQAALDKPDLWAEALDRVERPLYQAQVGIKDAQFLFVCGRDFDIGRGVPYIPTHAHPAKVSDTHEWVLLAAFFRGGLPASVNPDILFPEKSVVADSLADSLGDGDEVSGIDSVPLPSSVGGDDFWQ